MKDHTDMTRNELAAELTMCKKELVPLAKKAPVLRHGNLKSLIKVEEARRDQELATVILNIVHWEAVRRRRQNVNQTTKKAPQACSPLSVKVPTDKGVESFK